MTMIDDELLNVTPPSKFGGIRASAWIEIFGFFVITSVIALYFDIPINYFNVSPHPYWIVVILMAAQYGTIEGLFAAFIATLFLELGTLPERNILQEKSAYILQLAKNPLMWFVSSVILGELHLRQQHDKDLLLKLAKEASKREDTIAEAYNSLKKIKERLEIHVATEMQTTLMVIDAFKQLEEHNEEGEMGVIRGAIELTKTLVAPEKFSIFFLEDHVLQCQAINGWRPEDNFKDHFDQDTPLYQEIIVNRKSVSLYTSNPLILESEGVLAVPIQSASEKKVFGMIKIEQIPLTRLNTSTIETLHLIGEWIGKSYSNYLSNRMKNVQPSG